MQLDPIEPRLLRERSSPVKGIEQLLTVRGSRLLDDTLAIFLERKGRDPGFCFRPLVPDLHKRLCRRLSDPVEHLPPSVHGLWRKSGNVRVVRCEGMLRKRAFRNDPPNPTSCATVIVFSSRVVGYTTTRRPHPRNGRHRKPVRQIEILDAIGFVKGFQHSSSQISAANI